MRSNNYIFGAGLLIGFGSTVRLLAIIENDDFDTRIKTPENLCTSGIYSKMRHPSYSGSLLIGLGIGLIALNPKTALILSAILFFYFDNRADREENLLENEFPEFLEYKEKTNKYL